MMSLLCRHDVNMMSPWCHHDICIVSPWCHHDVTMMSPWCHRDVSIVSLCCHYSTVTTIWSEWREFGKNSHSEVILPLSPLHLLFVYCISGLVVPPGGSRPKSRSRARTGMWPKMVMEPFETQTEVVEVYDPLLMWMYGI